MAVGFSVDALNGLPQASTGKNSSRPMKIILKCTDDSFGKVEDDSPSIPDPYLVMLYCMQSLPAFQIMERD